MWLKIFLLLVLLHEAEFVVRIPEMTTFDDFQRQEMLEQQTYYRRKEAKAENASNILILEWSEKLEDHTLHYIRECSIKNSPPAQRRKFDPLNANVGEVIGVKYGYVDVTNLSRDITKWWYDQKPHYTYIDGKPGTCKSGEECHGYLHMIWSRITRIGCAGRSCRVKETGRRGYMIICNFAPAPKEGVYSKPPYKKGSGPCTDCPYFASDCHEGLCTPWYHNGDMWVPPKGDMWQPFIPDWERSTSGANARVQLSRELGLLVAMTSWLVMEIVHAPLSATTL